MTENVTQIVNVPRQIIETKDEEYQQKVTVMEEQKRVVMIPRLVTETLTKNISVPRTVFVNEDVECKVSILLYYYLAVALHFKSFKIKDTIAEVLFISPYDNDDYRCPRPSWKHRPAS